jgi:hypothetical protein
MREMSHSAAGLAVPVEAVMTRRVVQIMEEIPMSEVRSMWQQPVSRNDLVIAIAPEPV